MSALAAIVQVGRDAARMVIDGLKRRSDALVHAAHRPTEVGPPERVACLRCMEPWPCAKLRRYEVETAGRTRTRSG